MKNRVLLLLLSSMSFQLIYGQCEVKEDPFSGEKTISYDYKNKSVFYSAKGEDISLEIKFNYNGEMNQYIEAGKDLMIKLDNGEVLSFKTTNRSTPVSSVIGQAIFSQYTFKVNVSPDDLKNLSESEATFVRYPDINDSYIDMELSKAAKKLQKSLMEGAQCIQSNS